MREAVEVAPGRCLQTRDIGGHLLAVAIKTKRPSTDIHPSVIVRQNDLHGRQTRRGEWTERDQVG